MAMGIPVITNAGVGDVQEVITKYDSGFVLEKMSQQNYSHYAGKLIDSSFDSKKIRDGAAEYYSLEKAIQKYADVYARVLNKTHTLLPIA